MPPPEKVPETTFYVYDMGGQRLRKVTACQNGICKNERIYLGGFEIYREFDNTGNKVKLERETLHIMDDKQRIALVETKTITNPDDESPTQLIRFQFSNHLGSASLELDEQANAASYEEYYPYGSTSYQAVDKSVRVAAKRYRYTGKERDEETGLYYHGARYYAPWLGRWINCDPVGISAGMNLFVYASNKPNSRIDPSGLDDKEPGWFSRNLGPASPFGQWLSHADYPGSSILQDDKKLATAQAFAEGVAVAGGVGAVAAVAAPVIIAGTAAATSTTVGGTALALGASTTTAATVATTTATVTTVTLETGLVAVGVYQTTTTLQETVTGREAGTGRTLSSPERANRAGQLLVGGIALTYGGVRAYRGQKGASSGSNAGARSNLKPPSDPYDVEAWNSYYKANPTKWRSVGAAAADDSTVFKQNETKPQANARVKAAIQQFLELGRKITVIKKSVEEHHVASDKAIKTGWTAKFQALFDKAGISLQDKANLVSVEGHKNAHGSDYHSAVYRRLSDAVEGKTGQEYKDALVRELTNIKRDILRANSYLNHLVTGR